MNRVLPVMKSSNNTPHQPQTQEYRRKGRQTRPPTLARVSLSFFWVSVLLIVLVGMDISFIGLDTCRANDPEVRLDLAVYNLSSYSDAVLSASHSAIISYIQSQALDEHNLVLDTADGVQSSTYSDIDFDDNTAQGVDIVNAYARKWKDDVTPVIYVDQIVGGTPAMCVFRHTPADSATPTQKIAVIPVRDDENDLYTTGELGDHLLHEIGHMISLGHTQCTWSWERNVMDLNFACEIIRLATEVDADSKPYCQDPEVIDQVDRFRQYTTWNNIFNSWE